MSNNELQKPISFGYNGWLAGFAFHCLFYGDATMMQHEYTRKPSFVQINCKIRDARAKGATFLQLTWGENQITLEKTPNGWLGSGWIGKTGGADIAAKINRNT